MHTSYDAVYGARGREGVCHQMRGGHGLFPASLLCKVHSLVELQPGNVQQYFGMHRMNARAAEHLQFCIAREIESRCRAPARLQWLSAQNSSLALMPHPKTPKLRS